MFWNLILLVKDFYKKQTCVHNYKIDKRTVMLSMPTVEYCTKCWNYRSFKW